MHLHDQNVHERKSQNQNPTPTPNLKPEPTNGPVCCPEVDPEGQGLTLEG